MEAKKAYERLAPKREPFLRRARDSARFTIPSLLPERGHTEHTQLPDQYQSMGARGTNNLASKLLLALFPPNSPFFRLAVSDYELEQLAGDETARADVEEALNKIERTVQNEVEASALRVTAFEVLKLLVVTGNCLLHIGKDGDSQIWRLDSYVTRRDASGNLQEIVTKDTVALQELDEDTREQIDATLDDSTEGPQQEEVDVYTHIYFDGSRWKTYQEIKGEKIDGTEADYPKDRLPYLALRWTKIDDEDYGRSFIEEYIGDLRSLEALSRATVEGTVASAKVIYLVRSGGTTRVRTIAEAPNLAVRQGDENDVSVLRTDKHADFRVALDMMNNIEERLASGFLLTASIQRQAERVTAQEIRVMAAELEDALGGVYSILSQEFQLPLVNVLLHRMGKAGKIPQLPDESVQPRVVAGLEALGRGHDLQKLQTLIQNLAPLGEEVISRHLNVSDAIKRMGTALGIDMDGLVKSEQQIAQEQAQSQQDQVMSQAMGEMARAQVNPRQSEGQGGQQ